MKASVIIPCHGRENILDRAIKSVIALDIRNQVQIVVVDDYSASPIKAKSLRSHDKLIRLESKKGAAIARNVGMYNADGQIIYLLDSDDYFISRNFDLDYELAINNDAVFYCEIESNGYKSNFPNKIAKEEYFYYIFHKYKHIGQTSSLFFKKSLNIVFDENLPKHQDWDFLYFSVLNNGLDLRKSNGLVYFDRDDKGSLSRKRSVERSYPWFEKILKNSTHDIYINNNVPYVRYNLFSSYIDAYSTYDFIVSSLKLLFLRKVSLFGLVKNIYKRNFL